MVALSPLPLFRRFLAPYRWRLGALVLLVLGATLSEGIGVGLFYPLIVYIEKGSVFLQQGSGQRLARLLAVVGVAPSPATFIGLIFLAIVFTMTLKWAVLAASARIYIPLMKDLRDHAFAQILESRLSFFQAGSSANLTHTLDDEVENVGQSFNFAVLLATGSVAVVVYAAILVVVSWRLTALVAAIGAARYGVSSLVIRRMRALGEQYSGLRVRLKGSIVSVYQGIEVIKAFATEAFERQRFERLTGQIAANAGAIAETAAANGFFEGLLGDALLCVVVYLAVARLRMQAAGLLTFLFVVTRIIPKISGINDARIRLAEYLSRLHFLPEALAAEGLPRLTWGSRPKPAFEREIALEGVSFSYPNSEFPSLSGVSLRLAKGETLALVGESGAGKSTLARLLLRLFDPNSGRVLVDGIPLPELRREDWARLVSVVSQEAFIFDDTLENNVRYGSPGCTPQQLQDALRRARALDFVEALPERAGTRLGERGANLSGGQRQRVAIARAFLRDAPILILDEATSAMDSVTERLIQDAIEDLARDRTMLVIAHRFATIRNADRIVVLDKGRVAESGTHEELMERGMLYRRYHDLQVR